MADIDKMASRPAQYLAQTGLPQLMGGLTFIVLGASALIQQTLGKGLVALLVVPWIGVCCAGPVVWAVSRSLRRRIVFPRGGYVVPRIQPGVRAIKWGGIVAGVGLGIFVSALPGSLHWFDSRFIPPGFAISFAILLLGRGWRQRSGPTLWCSLYFVGLAALLWWMPGNSYARMSALQLASGILMAGAGAVTLRRYLRETPKLVEPQDE
jgi:hypothetical protein